VHKCLHETGPAYLADELSNSSDFESQCRLRLASSLNLIARCTRSSIYRDRAFLVAGPRLWNFFSLPSILRSQLTFSKLALKLFSYLGLFFN